MSHTQHTPGPWTVEIDRWHYDTASTVVAGAERPTFPFRELLVQVGGTDLGRQEANTRLIAAAPRLLSAAKRVTAAFRAMGQPASVIGLVSKLRAECEASMLELDEAIKQAEGTAP